MHDLQQTIRLPQAVALYVGAVLGSGILLVPGLAAELAGPASLLAWGLMLFLVLPMGLTMGLLSSRHPHSGGVAHFVSLAFGEKWSIYVGWFFLMSVAVGAPVAALTGAGYLSEALGLGEMARIAIALFILLLALLINGLGMKLGGNIQFLLVIGIIAVLLSVIFSAWPMLNINHFTPFLPHGWFPVGEAATILFWCYIGWEAVSHLSSEFVNPKRDTIVGVLIAAVIVGLLYFLTAFVTVGTQHAGAQALSALVMKSIGPAGSLFIGLTSFLICTATVIAYSGAASRLAFALGAAGHGPRFFTRQSSQQRTPIGGLLFLSACFAVVLSAYGSQWITLAQLLQLPNATFILTYLAGCASGIKLLRDSVPGAMFSWVSFIFTLTIIPFIGWALLYPLLIGLSVGLILLRKKRIKRKNPSL
ncbi:APC family permease [Laceyella putida]|uniref:APC family permease n=1 Tax=Laceyella putida TaxID=110101 RepID=A0ABW2RIR2_9BACL